MKHTDPPIRPARTRYYLEHPEQFNITTLESNEMDRGDGLPPLAKIPQLEDRIRFAKDESGFYTNVLLVTARETKETKETEETEEKTVLLGTISKTMLYGMMITSDVYHDYFDTSGNLIHDPMNPEEEPENEEEQDNPEKELQRRIREEFQQHNAIQLGNTTFVRIPEIPSRIRILKPNNKDIRNVQYIYAQWYDPTAHQNRNKKIVIGHLANECPEAMIPNDSYNRFFDINTGLPRPETETEQPNNTNPENQNDQGNPKSKTSSDGQQTERTQQTKQSQQPQLSETNLLEEIENQQEKERQKQRAQLSRRLKEDPEKTIATAQRLLDRIQEEMQQEKQTLNEPIKEALKEPTKEPIKEPINEPLTSLYDRVTLKNGRKEILMSLLDDISYTICNQAKKHPETLIGTYKAQKINAVLIELKLFAHGSGFEDFLELIKEPEEVEQDGQKFLTGMTYSDAEVLLSHYSVVLSYLRRHQK